jgi:putative isomerase
LLARWTEWYLRHRDSNQDGLPEYRHGNEAGWDNATVFDGDGLIESPDLSAYLSVQMEVLADVAARLGRPIEARRWKQQSNQLLERMVRRFWQGDQFVPIHVTDGRIVRSQSLLLCMPVILGTRLPPSVRDRLIATYGSELLNLTSALHLSWRIARFIKRTVTGADQSGRPQP